MRGKGMNIRENIRKNLYQFTVILAGGIVILAGSVLIFKTTIPGDLPISEDGYFEICTAYDYEKFWRLVNAGQNFVNGRLMKDIYFNDLTDYEKWERTAPPVQSFEVKEFKGDFDGNGHALYGIYSENGYGLVEENKGRIHDLSIRKSLIAGDLSVGGICRKNRSLIEGCDFRGRLKSQVEDADAVNKIAGICAENEGTILRCIYRGTMTVNETWQGCGVRAGICGRNRGRIEECCNLTRLDETTGGRRCFAIADTGVKHCYVIRDSFWEYWGNQVIPVEKEKEPCLLRLLEGESAVFFPEEGVRTEYQDQIKGMREGILRGKSSSFFQKNRKELSVPASPGKGKDQEDKAEEIWREPERIGDAGILKKEMKSQTRMKDLIRAALWYKQEDWRELRLENMEEEEEKNGPDRQDTEFLAEAPRQLRISAGKDKVDITACQLKEEPKGNYDRLWEICSFLLGENRAEDWEHHTWRMAGGSSMDEESAMILYSTEKGEEGFFYLTGKELYRVRRKHRMGEERLEQFLKEIAYLAGERERKNEIRTDSGRGSSREDPSEPFQEPDTLWEAMLEELWISKSPDATFLWRDENVKQAVYTSVTGDTEQIPSRERLLPVDSLILTDPGDLNTLQDLANLPLLASLRVIGCGETKVNFDLDQDAAPQLFRVAMEGVRFKGTSGFEKLSQLKQLYLTQCGLDDISFVEKMPGLTDISFYGNRIRDISPLKGCRKLEILSLAENEIEDISVLPLLPALREAGLQENEIRDLSPLAGMEKLTGLNLTSNRITDIAALKGNTSLTALGLGGNEIRDITSLKGMKEMYNLALDFNQIEDISPLAEMTKMEHLGLTGNRIQDYTPLKNMETIFYLSVAGNPGQDIGEKAFVPYLVIGQADRADRAVMEEAEGYLEKYYPGETLEAEDITRGDLNGDGITDMAITALSGDAEDGGRIRRVYPFLGKRDGNFQALSYIEILNEGFCGYYGGPYQGILITDQKLVIQEYSSGGYYWAGRKIYEYKRGKMRETWEMYLNHLMYVPSYSYGVYNLEKGSRELYAITGEEEKHKQKLLFEDSAKEEALWQQVDEYLQKETERTGRELPELYKNMIIPQIDRGEYDYQIRAYPVKERPRDVLARAAERFLTPAAALPVVAYGAEEVKESYDLLTGVTVPEEFYFGYAKRLPRIISYNRCEKDQNGSYDHVLTMWMSNEDYSSWLWDREIFYCEDTGEFREGGYDHVCGW